MGFGTWHQMMCSLHIIIRLYKICHSTQQPHFGRLRYDAIVEEMSHTAALCAVGGSNGAR